MNTRENRTILVGVDGSHGSITALKWAAVLAEGIGAEITAAMVWRNLPTSGRFAIAIAERPPDDIDHQLIEQLHIAAVEAGVENVDFLPLRGEAHEALLRAAAQLGVTLLIVGTRGLGPIGGLLLGSVSRRLLFSATLPLVLVPDDGVPEEIDHIVIGLDESLASRHAAAWSAKLCASLDAAATVVHCIEPGAEHSPERLDEIMTVAQLTFEKDECTVFRGLGVRHRAVVRNGDPRVCLIETAKKERAGLIVVGQHGEGQFSGLGGTASYLVQHSPVPLSIVPAAVA